MRILFVTPYVPSLIRVRPFNFIRQLCRRHSVTLVCLAQGDKIEEVALDELRGCCDGVLAFPMSKARSLANCCRRLLTPVPLQAAYTIDAEVSSAITAMARSRPFDLLHVEHIRGAHLTEAVREIPRVFDSVDCITRLLKLRLAQQCNPLQRALHTEELLKMRRYEPAIADAFDRVVVTSERDRRALDALTRRLVASGQCTGNGADDRRIQDGCDRLTVVPNGVDCDYFHPMDVGRESDTIVFSGRMSYYPNSSAVIRFYEDIFPIIKSRRSNARFRIVGSDPPEPVVRLARDPSVEVTGYVDDLRPYVASAAVVVCPLTVGVGIQNKVLEAMAMAKPVVVSTVAGKGIPDAEDGRHFVRVDDPSETAEAVLGLMDGPGFASAMGERARRFVKDEYSWEAAVRTLERVYGQAAESPAHSVAAAA